MKLSEQWLRRSVPDLSLDTEQLTQQLTMAGLEVSTVTPAAFPFDQVVVGDVIKVCPHPHADRLKCCVVRVSDDVALDIVCGAPNVRSGLKVAIVLVGGSLNRVTIKKSTLRGQVSYGMICSARELGLSDEHGKILELPDDAPVGQDLRAYLSLDDHIIDIELTPNRGDCASLLGLAREVAALNSLSVVVTPKRDIPASPAVLPDDAQPLSVTVTDKRACPRYVGCAVYGLATEVSIPIEMQELLRRSGIRQVHPIVDILNYVMLELGQPMHAFDLNRLEGGLQVRLSKPGDTITLLNEQTLALDTAALVIADQRHIQALAGIMGGVEAAVSPLTQDIFLESAYFAPAHIAMTARHYRMHTESSYRFERGVDFELQIRALERACELCYTILGGRPGPLIEHASIADLPQRRCLLLRRAALKRRIGIALDDTLVTSLLSGLGLTIQMQEKGWYVDIPSYRCDLIEEVDIIGEVARLYGYERVPPKPLCLQVTGVDGSTAAADYAFRTRLRTALVNRGYHETVSYSFIHDRLQKLIDPDQASLVLAKPITQDMEVMSTSLWPGLLSTMQYNQHRQLWDMRLFEMGHIFQYKHGSWQESVQLAGLMIGRAHSRQWGQEDRSVDFYDLKGDMMVLLSAMGLKHAEFLAGSHHTLHPGQSLSIYESNQCIGHLGALHPSLMADLGIEEGVPYLFLIDLKGRSLPDFPRYHPISKFPISKRDLAIVVPQSRKVQDMITIIEERSGQILHKVMIFDIYQGDGMESGKKSVAFELIFQHASRTLTDIEINAVVEDIVDHLEQACGAQRRV